MSLRMIAERAMIDVANGKPEEIATAKEMLKAYALRFADAMRTVEAASVRCDEQPVTLALDLDDESFDAFKASQLKGLEEFLTKLPAAEHVVWHATYNRAGDWDQPDEPDDVSYEKEAYAARHIGIYDTERFTDEDGRVLETVEICTCMEYGYDDCDLFFSPVGTNRYLIGEAIFKDGLDSVRAVWAWDGGLLGLYADLDASIDKAKVVQLNTAFRAFDDKYESDEYLELQYQKNGRLQGMCYGNYCIRAEQITEFFLDAEKLRSLVMEADPNGKLKMEGYLTANDVDHRFGRIRVQTDENGEFKVSSTILC